MKPAKNEVNNGRFRPGRLGGRIPADGDTDDGEDA
jgi:hypothetical protein